MSARVDKIAGDALKKITEALKTLETREDRRSDPDTIYVVKEPHTFIRRFFAFSQIEPGDDSTLR